MSNWKNALIQSKNEILLYLHVIPGSSQSVFPASYNKWRNSIEIKIESEAKENKANIEVINQIASFFNIKTRDISIIQGQKSREKIVAIKNAQIEELCSRIKGPLSGV